jgi:hypothetical protein
MTIDGERADARVASSRDDEEDASAAEYGDLLDAKWLEREGVDVLERDDDLMDVGLTLDLDDDDDDDENSYAVDLDVGTLLTSLLPADDPDSIEPALNDGSLASGALSDVLLPEERSPEEQRADDDDAVGDDEQFPAFDESDRLPERPTTDDDGSEGLA